MREPRRRFREVHHEVSLPITGGVGLKAAAGVAQLAGATAERLLAYVAQRLLAFRDAVTIKGTEVEAILLVT